MQQGRTVLWYVLLWYSCGSLLNNVLKSFVTRFPFPVTLAFANQLPALLLVAARLVSRTVVQSSEAHDEEVQWGPMLFLGCCSTGAQVLHRFSLLSLHASFVQTLKAFQPIFTASVSRCCIDERLSMRTYLALLLIICGVITSCFSEGVVEAWGMAAAVCSTLCLSFGAVGSKRLLKQKEVYGALNDEAIWLLTAQGTGLILIPLLLFEWPNVMAQKRVSWGTAATYISVVSILTSLQTRIAFKVLVLVSPTTHSVIGAMKRLVVITCSIVYFGNIPTRGNILGILTAGLGTLLYNRFRTLDSKIPQQPLIPLSGSDKVLLEAK